MKIDKNLNEDDIIEIQNILSIMDHANVLKKLENRL